MNHYDEQPDDDLYGSRSDVGMWRGIIVAMVAGGATWALLFWAWGAVASWLVKP